MQVKDQQPSLGMVGQIQECKPCNEKPSGFMAEALVQARIAGSKGEVPVGAVLVEDGQIIARAYNRPISDSDPSSHAEIVCLRAGARLKGNYRLPTCTLYVSLEPCSMCIGAILQARLREVVFAVDDPKTGACGSILNIPQIKELNHHTHVTKSGGVMAEESAQILRDFFAKRRAQQKLNIGRVLPNAS